MFTVVHYIEKKILSVTFIHNGLSSSDRLPLSHSLSLRYWLKCIM
jgi:hypothetical protein